MNKVKMVQTSKHKWRIESDKGHVIQDDIVISSPFEAKDYVVKYISSFMGWTYEVIPKDKK